MYKIHFSEGIKFSMMNRNKGNKFTWMVIAILAILTGLYPALYFIFDRKFIIKNKIGIMSGKSSALLLDRLWNIGFYTHITFGAIALLIGWIQFSKKIRSSNITLHRLIGSIYIICVLFSSIAGIYIGFFATGGFVASLGFICLGIIWLLTTIMAYVSIQRLEIRKHQMMMIYSYAACFAAVTLRIWLPLLIVSLDDFNTAYRITAWLCWVPNILTAYILTRKLSPQTSFQG